MLRWAIAFFIIALIAAILPGLGLVTEVAATLAWICAAIFLVLFVVALVTGRNATSV